MSNCTEKTFNLGHVGFIKYFLEDAEVSNKTKTRFLDLIKQRRIVILNRGAIIDPDTVLTDYQDILTQFRAGNRYISDILGLERLENGNVSFVIDSFGISFGYAKLMHALGFDSLLFTRSPTFERNYRRESQRLSFSWQVSDTEMINTMMTTDHYNYPKAMKFRLTRHKEGYNIFDRDFIRLVRDIATVSQQLSLKKKETIQKKSFLFFGDDFAFKLPKHFKDMDLFISFFRSNAQAFQNSSLEYSTVDRYFSKEDGYVPALNDIKSQKTDFVPYLIKGQYSRSSSWTGFYSSRSYYKNVLVSYNKFARAMISIIAQFSEKIYKNFSAKKKIKEILNEAKWLVGIFTHHDAITGTSPLTTMDDYVRRIVDNERNLINLIQGEEKNYKNSKNDKNFDYKFFDGSNNTIWSSNSLKNGSNLVLLNPIGQKKFCLKIEINKKKIIKIKSLKNLKEIKFSIFCSLYKKDQCLQIFNFEMNSSPLQFFKIETIQTQDHKNNTNNILEKKKAKITKNSKKEFLYKNGKKLSFLLKKNSLQILKDNKIFLKIKIVRYIENQFNPNLQRSGVYTMSVIIEKPFVAGLKNLELSYEGDVVYAMATTSDELRKLIVKVDLQEPRFVESELLMSPLSDDRVYHHSNTLGIRYETDIVNEQELIDQASGIYEFKRKFGAARNFHQPSSYVEQNTFPISSSARIVDKKTGKTMVVFVDRPVGVTMIKDGQLDIFLQRYAILNDAVSLFGFMHENVTILVKNKIAIFDQFDEEAERLVKAETNCLSNPAQAVVFDELSKGLVDLQNESFRRSKEIGRKVLLEDFGKGLMYIPDLRIQAVRNSSLELTLTIVNLSSKNVEINSFKEKICNFFGLDCKLDLVFEETNPMYFEIRENNGKRSRMKNVEKVVVKGFGMKTFVIS